MNHKTLYCVEPSILTDYMTVNVNQGYTIVLIAEQTIQDYDGGSLIVTEQHLAANPSLLQWKGIIVTV